MGVTLVGDMAIRELSRHPGWLDIVRGHGSELQRILVPEDSRLALAQAIAGEGYRVVPSRPTPRAAGGEGEGER